MSNNIITVSSLNLFVKTLLESEERLKNIWLRGEISNLTDHYRSGHIYLTLKDERSAVRAVMFAGHASRLTFRPQDGMKVLVRGRVTLYDVTGSYQVNIEEMQPDGVGALSIAFEQLKACLRQEGLYDERHKQPLPLYPKRIGVITSPTGAAVQDIQRILKRRYPIGEIILYPVTVQGDRAAAELTEAVCAFDRSQDVDVIIIGRGGGSIEDLWAFNNEELARAIYGCSIPVISAVGHETDFTICDFVADVRASTPSAGAELAAPEMSGMLEQLQRYQDRLTDCIHDRLTREMTRWQRLRSSRVLQSPQELIQYRRMKLDTLVGRMSTVYTRQLSAHKERFVGISAKLEAISPLRVLSRGYAIAYKKKRVLRSVKEVAVGDTITVTLTDGTLIGTVTDRKEDSHG